MKVIKSQEMRVPESKAELEIKEEFCALMENIKSEAVDIKPAILPGSSEYPESISQTNNDISLLLRCRLCAFPSYNMIDIFSCDETDEDIAEKIERCVRIVVKETDTLPKQACQTCLVELELCFKFQQTVAEAEKQLLSLDRQISGKLEETERNLETSKLYDEECATEHDNIEITSKTVSEIEKNNDKSTTIAEGAQITDTTVNSNLALASLKPCSVVLVPIVSPCRNNRSIDGRRASDDDEHRNIDSFTEDLDTEKTSASRIDLQSTCESEGPGETRRSPQANPEKILSPHCERRFDDEDNQTIHNRVHIKKPRYRCNLCAKLFTIRSSLTRHQKVHTGEKPYSCEYCEKKFAARSSRNSHHLIHTGERPFKCSICSKMFRNKQNLTRHQKVHTGEGLYNCEYCEEKFRDKLERDRHHITHTAKARFKCSVRNKSFGSREVRKHHMSIHASERLWQCDYCKKNYKKKCILSAHLICCNKRPDARLGSYSCEYCGKTFLMERYRDIHHLLHTTDRQRLFKCSICGKAFFDSHSLKRHTARHSAARDYPCSLCNKSFKSTNVRAQHMSVHTSEKPWQCDYCKKNYKRKCSLSVHLICCDKRPVARLESYSCEYCGKTFPIERYRDAHHLIHATDRQRLFKCSICGRAFFDSHSLKRHSASHSEARDYPCSLCNKSFKSTNLRTQHMSVHTSEKPWQCDYCKKYYKKKCILSVHLICCNKRPDARLGSYSCEYCGKTFSIKRYRDTHHLIHTTDRQRLFKCSICGKAFIHSHSLKRHSASHSEARDTLVLSATNHSSQEM